MKRLKQNLINRKKALYLYMGFFSCMTLATACKEKGFSNSDAIPEVDNINTFAWDADNIKVRQSYLDTLLTNDNEYPLAAIGKISSDPFFGKTNGGLYVQFETPILSFSFADNLVMDSTVLSIPYYAPTTSPNSKIFYGDTSKNMVVNVHRISEPFVFDSEKTYYSNDALNYQAQALAQKSFKLSEVFDTVELNDGNKVSNLLRINLPASFGQEILNLDAATHLSSTSAFQNYFPGLYITADPNSTTELLGLFNVSDGNRSIFSTAQMTFYGHVQGDTTIRVYQFKFNYKTCSWFNAITRNYAGTPSSNYINNSQSDSIIIQGAPGISSILEIPIDRIPAAIINKAELVLTAQNLGDESIYATPNQIIVKGIDEDGNEYNLTDYISSVGFTYIGGSKKTVTINGNEMTQYSLNMPRELQRLRDQGKNTLKLRISANTAHLGFYRTIIYGPNATDALKPKFNVIYSIK